MQNFHSDASRPYRAGNSAVFASDPTDKIKTDMDCIGVMSILKCLALLNRVPCGNFHRVRGRVAPIGRMLILYHSRQDRVRKHASDRPRQLGQDNVPCLLFSHLSLVNQFGVYILYFPKSSGFRFSKISSYFLPCSDLSSIFFFKIIFLDF